MNPIQKEYQNPNLWEMLFYSTGRNNFDEDELAMKFLIRSTDLPFEKFETETRSTGSKHISGVEFVEEFSVEFNETEDLKVITFLEKWMDQIYDKKRRAFRSGVRYNHTKEALFSIQRYGIISDLRIAGALSPAAAIAGAYEYTKVYRFKNVLLVGIDNMSWAYGESENKTVTASFTTDEIEPVDSGMPKSLELL